MLYCSISSGCVVGTISTAIWVPFFGLERRSFASMRFHRLTGQGARQIGHPRGELRHRDLGSRGQRGQKED